MKNTGAIRKRSEGKRNRKKRWKDRTGNPNRKGMIHHGSNNAAALVDSVGSDKKMSFEDLKPNDRKICQNCVDWIRDVSFHPLWTDKQSHWGLCESAKPHHNCRYFNHTCKRFVRGEAIEAD